ncbi:SLBB domain-containing protein [Gammaproteobacteria bacterium]|nr:SLBB domain-containing protein [Gammaproteobacteria bacterium]
MRKTSIPFIAFLYLIVPIIFAQELDDAFLDSLPDGVREDVLDKVNIKKDQIDSPVYRSASSKVDKDKLEEDFKNKVFGAEFFDTIQTSFMPINEPNLDASYVLDFGDVIEIQLIGQENSTDDYPVKRDGSISISDIGKIFVSGLALGDAVELIQSKIDSAYIGTKAFVSLTSIRDIGVLIAGNAYNPGIYTLNGNSNMLHALSMAGGIDEIGSYRDISLIRNNEVIDTLDIYDVLIRGKTSYKTRLRSGDSILVNPSKKIVSIESGVPRPGIYELKEGETFEDLINFANGIGLNADISNIILKRAENGESKVINININEIEKYDVKRGDSLFIREYKFNTVSINGAVKNPGTYLMPLGTSLSELIISAGGYENSAYPFGGVLNNKRSLEINEESKEKLYEKFLNNLIRNASVVSSDQESLALVLKQLRDAETNGRVIAEFDLDVIRSNPSNDTILENGDEILIPVITQQVYVQGEVSNPGAIRYTPGKSINYYVSGSGGMLDSADAKTIFVVHPNGETQNISSNRLSFISSQDNFLMYPGSIIYVPKSFDPNSTQIASIWAPILSSLALSLASISALNNN